MKLIIISLIVIAIISLVILMVSIGAKRKSSQSNSTNAQTLAADKAVADKDSADKAIKEAAKVAAEKAAVEKAAVEKASALSAALAAVDKATAEKDAADKAVKDTAKAAADKAVKDAAKAAADKAAAEKAMAEKAMADKVAADKVAAEKAAAAKAAAEKAAAAKAAADKAAALAAKPPQKIKLNETIGKETPTVDNCGGNTLCLDRYNLDCGSKGVIRRLQLKNTGDGKAKYEYTCSNLLEDRTRKLAPQNTLYNQESSNSAYLDRHDVNCQKGSISQVNLGRDGKGNFRYNYKCNLAPVSAITNHSTPLNDDGGGNSGFLDRHNIRCPVGKVLTGFKMVKNGNQIQYKYRCGVPMDKEAQPTKQKMTVEAFSLNGYLQM